MNEIKNAFKEKPTTMSHITFKEQGVKVDIIIGSKLLNIKVKDFIPQETPITNENIQDASVLCMCACSNYCIFSVKELTDPDILPSCSDCQADIEHFIAEEALKGRKLTLLQAWESKSVFKNEIQYSRVFLDFADRSNSYHHISNQDNLKVSLPELKYHHIRLRNLCSALRGKNTKLSTPHAAKYNFQCLCQRFVILDSDVLNTFEPIGVCSLCAHELRYSLQHSNISAKTQKLELKRIWQAFLREHNYPALTFKTMWELYLSERRVRRKDYIELHFKDFLVESKNIHVKAINV